MYDTGDLDGRCGIPSLFTLWDGSKLYCRFEAGHQGDHEWKKHESKFHIMGGVTRSEFLEHVHPVPEGCTCKPIRLTSEDRWEDGRIVDWVFEPACPVHTRTAAFERLGLVPRP